MMNFMAGQVLRSFSLLPERAERIEFRFSRLSHLKTASDAGVTEQRRPAGFRLAFSDSQTKLKTDLKTDEKTMTRTKTMIPLQDLCLL
jgi:hypothetical protein